MKLVSRLAVAFYSVFTIVLASIVGLYVSHGVPYLVEISFEDVNKVLYAVYTDTELRILVGGVALGLLLINYILMKSISINHQKGRTIAFDNPSGRVSVSLAAMEDLVRRIIAREPEVRDVRASIVIGKKGLEVCAKLILNVDTNIPEMTSRVQELVKQKIQDTIGIEETVVVRVDVDKIIPGSKKIKNKKEVEPPPAEPTVPFQGYRA